MKLKSKLLSLSVIFLLSIVGYFLKNELTTHKNPTTLADGSQSEDLQIAIENFS